MWSICPEFTGYAVACFKNLPHLAAFVQDVRADCPRAPTLLKSERYFLAGHAVSAAGAPTAVSIALMTKTMISAVLTARRPGASMMLSVVLDTSIGLYREFTGAVELLLLLLLLVPCYHRC